MVTDKQKGRHNGALLLCAEGSSLQPLLDAALDAGTIEPQ